MKAIRYTPLALFLALALAHPAWAEEVEETDDLPLWAEDELEDARSWDEVEVRGMSTWGSDIPDPEDVARGRRPAPPPAKAAPAPAQAPRDGVLFEDFYAGLHPHGRWVETPEYGLVFVPGAHVQVRGWRPYLHGQWVWTSHGWTWASDEPFGWATYHYGRWAHSSVWGWYWVPGYVWGPAWVAWRYGPDSIGWAPLYPGYVTVGASFPVYVDHWVFIGHRHFHGHPVHRHWHRGAIHQHFHGSHWARHWRSSGRVYAGPPRRWVEERHGGGRIVETRIVHSRSPSVTRVVDARDGRRVDIYRPGVKGAIRPVGERPPVRTVRGRPAPGSGLVKGSPAREIPRRGGMREEKRPTVPTQRPKEPRGGRDRVGPGPQQKRSEPQRPAREGGNERERVRPAPPRSGSAEGGRRQAPEIRGRQESIRPAAPAQRQQVGGADSTQPSRTAPRPDARQAPARVHATPRQAAPPQRPVAPARVQAAPTQAPQRPVAPAGVQASPAMRAAPAPRTSAPQVQRRGDARAPSVQRAAPASGRRGEIRQGR